MIAAHVLKPIPGVRVLPFLGTSSELDKRLFQKLPASEYQGLMRDVPPQEADILIIPHEYAVFRKYPSALDDYFVEASRIGKRVLLSAYQDNPAPLEYKNAIILRASAYKSALLPNEIIMPAYVEDLGRVHGTKPIAKNVMPSVGFVGKVGFKDVKEVFKYFIRNYGIRQGAEREGMYFRRHAVRVLERDSHIDLKVIARKTFSAHKESIELPPAQARREYIENIKDSLFTLSPRGDGNFSLRFYETLSLGRIPILIDTDMPLPLEDRIHYNEFIVRVPWKDIAHIGDYVMKFFALPEEEILRRQRLARETFEKHLYMPRFLETVLNEKFLASIPYA